jgi:methionyl-tRNA formyltransferase
VRVVFFGNHTVGVRTVEVIAAEAELAGVIAHPPDEEDGVRYESVFDTATRWGVPVVRLPGRAPELGDVVSRWRPDLLWVTDYRYLISAPILALARLGAVNLHPSLLPRYRGRAPLNWAILNGETELGLTAHYIDEGMDTGDIIDQRTFSLSVEEDVGDALERLYPLYGGVTRSVLAGFRRGSVRAVKQDHSQATAFPRRQPEDGLIDWTVSASRVRDLVRAVARPYPGAFAYRGSDRVVVWRARVEDHESELQERPGRVVTTSAGVPVISTGSGRLALLDVELAPGATPLREGDVFSAPERAGVRNG